MTIAIALGTTDKTTTVARRPAARAPSNASPARRANSDALVVADARHEIHERQRRQHVDGGHAEHAKHQRPGQRPLRLVHLGRDAARLPEPAEGKEHRDSPPARSPRRAAVRRGAVRQDGTKCDQLPSPAVNATITTPHSVQSLNRE